MQSNDRHTLMVADHGVDPSPLPGVDEQRSGVSGNGDGARGKDSRGSLRHDILVWCGIPILVVLLVRILLIGCYVIPSGSMLDTIRPGDKIATVKTMTHLVPLHRGDIIVFKDPADWLPAEDGNAFGDEYLIKRLIGMPGDVVACAGAGHPVTVNGVAIDESAYLRDGVDPSAFPFRVEVTEGHLFVMGDNRANSADSRYHQDDSEHGLVPVSDVVGVAIGRYWPFDRVGAMADHRDVFADVPDASTDTAAGASMNESADMSDTGKER
ncbi:signal peptidase I [Bifidobacterium aerophilum]|nr:signal peptidase I [Bifidobacterium aerophilum]